MIGLHSFTKVVVSIRLHSFLKHVCGGRVGVGGVYSASTSLHTSSVSVSVTLTQTGVLIMSSIISHLEVKEHKLMFYEKIDVLKVETQ